MKNMYGFRGCGLEKFRCPLRIMDVLRAIAAEIEGLHAMLDASLISGQLTDLRTTHGDQFLPYMRNLPDKVAEYVQFHSE